MQARLLGWAGVQLRDGGSTIAIDPLDDPRALWAAAGELARDVTMPELVAPAPPQGAVAGLVTHLHRDHADAGALAATLSSDAPVLLPEPFGGEPLEEAGLAQAAGELDAAKLRLDHLRPWERRDVNGWAITALPAADGTGDPQLSWLVERGGAAVVHGGDTLNHGWWWRTAQRARFPIEIAFLPINGARVRFPHRRPASPLPAVMAAREAVIATLLLGARRLVPIHYGAFDLPPLYVSDPDALDHVRAAADEHDVSLEVPAVGEWFDVAQAVAA